MWRAANALVVLTLIQVFVGAFTIYFLVKTFTTQRSELGAANKAANAAIATNEIALTKSSPIINVVSNFVRNGDAVDISLVLQNLGDTIARELTIDFWLQHK